jgi:hypothetical protein
VIGLWIAAGVAAWMALAVPVAVVIGRSIRMADGARPPGTARNDKRLVYRCTRCRQRVDYASEQLADATGRVHELDCSTAMKA